MSSSLAEIADAIEVLPGGQVDSGPATPERLAQEPRVPVLARAQVKRNLDGRGGKRPTISDLHDSGDREAPPAWWAGLPRQYAPSRHE